MNIRTRSVDVKPVRKTLPYTITPIGDSQDLLVWKQLQAEKEIRFQEQKAINYVHNKARAVDFLVSGRPVTLTEAEHREIAALRAMKTKQRPVCLWPELKLKSKPPLLTRIYNTITTWFLNLNFEPKE